MKEDTQMILTRMLRLFVHHKRLHVPD